MDATEHKGAENAVQILENVQACVVLLVRSRPLTKEPFSGYESFPSGRCSLVNLGSGKSSFLDHYTPFPFL